MNALLSLEWTIALIVVGVIILVIGTLIIINQVNKNKFNEERKEKNLEIVVALGGKENIVSFKGTGSRLSLVLNDYSLVNDEELKRLGVSSILRMSNKITLVIGKDAQDIVDSLS